MKFTVDPLVENNFYTQGSALLQEVIPLENIKEVKEYILSQNKERNALLESPYIKKILTRPVLEIARQLSKTTPLRYGIDHFFSCEKHCPSGSLLQRFCLQGSAIGIMITLGEVDEEAFLLPNHLGEVLFVKPDKVIPFHQIAKKNHVGYLLIILTGASAIYVRNMKDPHVYEMKKEGISYGDKLSDTFHPIVMR